MSDVFFSTEIYLSITKLWVRTTGCPSLRCRNAPLHSSLASPSENSYSTLGIGVGGVVEPLNRFRRQ